MSLETQQEPFKLSDLERRYIRSSIRYNNAATFMYAMMGVLALVASFFLANADWSNNVQTGTGTNVIGGTYVGSSNAIISTQDWELIDGGSDPYGNPGDFDVPSDTPFYNPHSSSEPMVQVAGVVDECYTKYGHVSIYVVGLTPFGHYTAQTDWTNTGRYGYGDGRFAGQYGETIYHWSCYDSQGFLRPRRAYPIHITDRVTGFSATIVLVVGTSTRDYTSIAAPVFYVAPDIYSPYGK